MGKNQRKYFSKNEKFKNIEYSENKLMSNLKFYVSCKT